jgi:tetratricopeptide (TPR) repeat protein
MTPEQRLELLEDLKAKEHDTLRRASIGAWASIILAGCIGASLLYISYRELDRVNVQRRTLLNQVGALQAEMQGYKNDLNTVRGDLARARSSLSAARAAINAFHAGRLTDAVTLYDEALGADPDNAYLQNLRAYALFRLGRVDAAIAGQRKSVADDPTYAWGYFDLARFLCATSPARTDDARAAAKRAIELRPGMRAIMQNDGEFQRVCRHSLP